jgi:hypothetical protein
MGSGQKIMLRTFVVAGISILFFAVCSKGVPTNCSRVASVGGCDRFGKCGVTLDNGDVRTEFYPTVGQTSCIMEHRWIWE